jgi:predicted ATPase with chaperone activity
MKPYEIRGNAVAKRAFEVAQACGLRVMLIGPRGSSKTTLRAAFPDVESAERDSCLCGNYQNPGRECTCSARLLYRWYRRFERTAEGFDLIVETCMTTAADMLGRQMNAPEDDTWREKRVAAALEFGKTHLSFELDAPGQRTAEMAVRRLALTNGQWLKALRVARVIANLGASERIQAKHLAEAIQYGGSYFTPERIAAVTCSAR